MKITSRLLFSCYIGFIAASLAYFLYGPSGLFVYHDLIMEQESLERNLQELQGIHDELTAEFESLRYSGDTIELRARDLGYLGKNEVLIDIDTRLPVDRSYTVGRMMVFDGRMSSRHSISLLVGSIGMICSFVLMAGIFPSPQRGR